MQNMQNEKLVLIGVVNRQKDLDLILRKCWYRIPVQYAPKKKAGYLAFYQTRVFGAQGKKINYYARIKSSLTTSRQQILPDEKRHPRAKNRYIKYNLGRIQRPPRPIKNLTKRRVNFAFTTMTQLLRSAEISELFNIVPLEDIMAEAMRKNNIPALPQYNIMVNGRCRYRLDFAIIEPNRKIAIECDDEKWHGQPKQRKKDKIRDRWLKRQSWQIVRLSGNRIRNNAGSCIKEIKQFLV